MRHLWPQVHQPADGVRRPRQRPRFQPPAQQYEGDDDGRHVEMQMVSARRHPRHSYPFIRHSRESGNPHQQHNHRAVPVGHRSTQGDQRVHIGLQPAQAGESCYVKRPASPQLYRRRRRPQQQGIPPERQQSVRPGECRKTGQQQRGAADRSHQEPPEQVPFLFAAGVVHVRVGGVGVQPVAGIGDRPCQLVQRWFRNGCAVQAHRRPRRGQVDGYICHAGHRANRLANVMHASGAGHP